VTASLAYNLHITHRLNQVSSFA